MNLSADPCNDFYNYACGLANSSVYDLMMEEEELLLRHGFEDLAKPSYNGNSNATLKVVKYYNKCVETTMSDVDYNRYVKQSLDQFIARFNLPLNLFESFPFIRISARIKSEILFYAYEHFLVQPFFKLGSVMEDEKDLLLRNLPLSPTSRQTLIQLADSPACCRFTSGFGFTTQLVTSTNPVRCCYSHQLVNSSILVRTNRSIDLFDEPALTNEECLTDAVTSIVNMILTQLDACNNMYSPLGPTLRTVRMKLLDLRENYLNDKLDLNQYADQAARCVDQIDGALLENPGVYLYTVPGRDAPTLPPRYHNALEVSLYEFPQAHTAICRTDATTGYQSSHLTGQFDVLNVQAFRCPRCLTNAHSVKRCILRSPRCARCYEFNHRKSDVSITPK
uniref:Peptidase_M13_N domain-containing protein n=1 Tax=Panagrellus redivivus TaxID=6233 RepID=A0A7E4W250_PANRE